MLGGRTGWEGRCLGWTVLHWFHSCLHEGSQLWTWARYLHCRIVAWMDATYVTIHCSASNWYISLDHLKLVLSLILCLCSALSKEIGITVVAIFMVYEFFILNKVRIRIDWLTCIYTASLLCFFDYVDSSWRNDYCRFFYNIIRSSLYRWICHLLQDY